MALLFGDRVVANPFGHDKEVAYYSMGNVAATGATSNHRHIGRLQRQSTTSSRSQGLAASNQRANDVQLIHHEISRLEINDLRMTTSSEQLASASAFRERTFQSKAPNLHEKYDDPKGQFNLAARLKEATAPSVWKEVLSA